MWNSNIYLRRVSDFYRFLFMYFSLIKSGISMEIRSVFNQGLAVFFLKKIIFSHLCEKERSLIHVLFAVYLGPYSWGPWGQQSEQKRTDHLFSLLWEDTEEFQSQPGDISSPACPGSALGAPLILRCSGGIPASTGSISFNLLNI